MEECQFWHSSNFLRQTQKQISITDEKSSILQGALTTPFYLTQIIDSQMYHLQISFSQTNNG